MSEEEKFANTIRALYYEEAISCVTEKGHKSIEPLPENARPLDCINTWGIEMLAFGLIKGIEMGINLMKKEKAV